MTTRAGHENRIPVRVWRGRKWFKGLYVVKGAPAAPAAGRR